MEKKTGSVYSVGNSQEQIIRPKESPSPRRNLRTVIIEPVLALYFTAWIPLAPLVQQYLYSKIAEDYNLTSPSGGSSSASSAGAFNFTTPAYYNSTWVMPTTTTTISPTPSPGECKIKPNTTAYFNQQKVQAITAQWMMYTDLAMDIPSLMVALFLGTYGDRIGRKICLILPPVGAILRCVFYIIHSYFQLPLWFLIFGSICEGLSGSSTTLVSSCYAYLADTTTREKRGLRIAIADVVYGFCIGLSQAGMGFLIRYAGFRIAFFVVMAFHIVNILYMLFLVPQVKPETQEGAELEGKKSQKISIKFIFESFKVFSPNRGEKRRKSLGLLVSAFVLISTAQTARWGLQTLFALNYPLCWESSMLGIFNSLIAVITNISQILIAALCLKRIGDSLVVLIGSVSAFGYFVMVAVSTTTLMMLFVPVVGFASSLPTSIMRAMLSKTVEPWEQGALFASVNTLDKLLSTLGVAAFNLTYARTVSTFSGAVFLVLAGLVFIAFVLILIYHILIGRKVKTYSEEEKTNGEVKTAAYGSNDTSTQF